MKKNVVFIGGGGHSLVCADIINQSNNLILAGFVDIDKNASLSKNGYECLGDDQDLEILAKKYKYFFITFGQIKSPQIRIKVFKNILKAGGCFPVLKSNFSYVSPSVEIGKGSLIMNGCVINSYASIGQNCIINSNSVIEHEAKIESHVHIAPSAIILGNATIKEGTFVGAGSIIREGVTIKKNTVIKAGDRVMKDIL